MFHRTEPPKRNYPEMKITYPRGLNSAQYGYSDFGLRLRLPHLRLRAIPESPPAETPPYPSSLPEITLAEQWHGVAVGRRILPLSFATSRSSGLPDGTREASPA